MKILFMGTPEIAAQSLAAILGANHTVCGVYTREDKPVGRKQVVTPPPVKELAMRHGIPVFQPKTLRDDTAQAQIKALAPDLIIVVAYGRILPPGILKIPPKGCINLHVSLLPKYRGAAPIQWAILNGEKETGVSIIYLDEGIDTGDILKVAPTPIGANETSGELFERMARLGAQTLLEAVDEIAQDSVRSVPQDHTRATLAPMLTKEQAKFTFDADAAQLHNLVRGLNPWPVAFFERDGKKIKVLSTLVHPAQTGVPGEILSIKPLCVACRQGALTLLTVHPEGKSAMDGTAWALGHRLKAGDRF